MLGKPNRARQVWGIDVLSGGVGAPFCIPFNLIHDLTIVDRLLLVNV